MFLVYVNRSPERIISTGGDSLPRGRDAVVIAASGAWGQLSRGGEAIQGGAGIGLGRGYSLGFRGVSSYHCIGFFVFPFGAPLHTF